MIAGTLLKVNCENLIQALTKYGILRVSYGCTGIDLPAKSLKDPATRNSKLQGFLTHPGEDLNGYVYLQNPSDIACQKSIEL